MIDPVVRADAGDFIWLIVGVFWVIAQMAGAASKKKLPPRPAAGDKENEIPPADPLGDLLRRMAGTEEFRPAYPSEPKPVFAPESPWKPGEIESLPDIKPLRREAAAPETTLQPAKIPEIDVRPKMSAFRSSVPSVKLPAMSLNFSNAELSIGKTRNPRKVLNPADKSSLRQAMLCHIVFSRPKAFEQQ